MNSKDFLIVEEKLTEAFVAEIEKLSQVEATRRSPKFKESVALMVILTYCNSAEDQFLKFHERLARVFTSLTSPDQARSAARRAFGRPIFRRNAGRITAENSEECLCTWLHHESVSVDIPQSYKENLKASIMYLMACDINRFFSYCYPILNSRAAIEIPCFIDMFMNSSHNNQNSFDALIGEYVALNGLCFTKKCIGPQWSFSCETHRYDFALNLGRQITFVSVKSVNLFEIQNFENPRRSDIWPDPTDRPVPDNANETDQNETGKLVRFREGENALLHRCDCSHCAQTPLREVVIKKSMIIGGKKVSLGNFECDNKQKLEEILTKWMPADAFSVESSHSDSYDSSDEDSDSEDEEDVDVELAAVTLVAAKLFFELRYALCNFKQKDFRGQRFKLREQLISCMRQGGEARAQARPSPALIDRSNFYQQ